MKISKRRLLDALKKLILFSAIFHMCILIGLAVAKGDIVILNYFNILDLDLFWPGIIEGPISLIASLATAISLTGFFYWRSGVLEGEKD